MIVWSALKIKDKVRFKFGKQRDSTRPDWKTILFYLTKV